MTSLLPSTHLSRSDAGILGGVCQGIGEHFDINPNLLRAIWFGTVLLFGTGILLYAALWWIMPSRTEADLRYTLRQRGDLDAKLYRHHEDKRILGVCGAIARKYDVDPTYVRLLTLGLLLVTGPVVGLLYVAAGVFMQSSNGHGGHRHHHG